METLIEQIALATTCLEKEVTNRRLQAILEMHPADIGEMLGEMADKKRLLKKNYKGRWTTYTLNTSSEDDELPLFAFGSLQSQGDNSGVEGVKATILETGRRGEVSDQVSDQVRKLVEILQGEMSLVELLEKFGMNNRSYFRKHYLGKAMAGGYVEATLPASPRSPTQKYRLTEKGRTYLEAIKNHE